MVFDLKKKNGGAPLDTADIPKLLASARASITNPLTYETFEKTLRGAFDDDEKWRNDDQASAKLLTEINTIDPDKLDAKDKELDLRFAAKEVPASAYHQAKQLIQQHRAMYGQIDEQDIHSFGKAVFAVRDEVGKRMTINVGDDKMPDVWEKLSADNQTTVRVASEDFFKDEFRQNILMMSRGDPTQVPAIKQQAWDKASTKAQAYAKGAIVSALKAQQQAGVTAKVANQAANINQAKLVVPSQSAWSALMGNLHEPFISYAVKDVAPKGIRAPETHTAWFVPRPSEDIAKEIEAQKTTPQSEWDVMATPSYFYTTRRLQGDMRLPLALDLKALAAEITAPVGDETQHGAGNPGRAKIARQYYGIAKSMLGFTPQEITAGKTKHGVAFDPSQIDAKTIPVFRSVAELEKAWNKGDLTPEFEAVGDAVDPKHRMYAEDFYKAQLALLSARK